MSAENAVGAETRRQVDARSWRHVAPFLIGLVLFALLGILNHARGLELWRNYALSGTLLGSAVTYALWRTDVRIPAYIQIVMVGGLLLHYGGGSLAATDPYHMGLLGMHGVNGTYHVYEWWDNLTHGVGQTASAMAIAYLIELYQLRRGLGWSGFRVGLVAFMGSLCGGVGTELYEYFGKTAFQTIDQGGYTNTMQDLQFNLLGALVGSSVAVGVGRTRMWERIRSHWGPAAPQAPQPVPPAFAGFVAFLTLPAAATLLLYLRFLSHDVTVAEDQELYDPALQVLLASALLAALAWPATALAMRRSRRPA
ncbi:MAG TPA: hypothetical protein VI796_00860 [Candidatus Thermoplasmatota archaeon]|nr:hypothetical protein [Candidatus Thermoplasmatota archaeon]